MTDLPGSDVVAAMARVPSGAVLIWSRHERYPDTWRNYNGSVPTEQLIRQYSPALTWLIEAPKDEPTIKAVKDPAKLYQLEVYYRGQSNNDTFTIRGEPQMGGHGFIAFPDVTDPNSLTITAINLQNVSEITWRPINQEGEKQ